MRQTEGSMLCPSCRKLISVSTERCPHCGAARPGLWGYGPAISRLIGRFDPVSMIPIVCIALYVIALAIDVRGIGLGGGIFGMLSPSGKALFLLGSTANHDFALGRPYTMISAIYLHGGLLHIVFNLMWLRYLGPGVQNAFGPARFFLIWTFAGFFGFLLSNQWDGHSSVGASGSVFGMLGALLVVARVTGDAAMSRQLWQWVRILAIFGVVMYVVSQFGAGFGGIDHFAHIGGFVGGGAAAWALRRSIGRPEARATTIAAFVVAGITIASFLLSLVTGLELLRLTR